MELTFYFLLSLSVLEVGALAFLAGVNPLDLRGRALHPYNILGFVLGIVNVDFLSLFLFIDGGGQVPFARNMLSDISAVRNGFIFFFSCQTFLVLGITVVTLPFSTGKRREQFVFPPELSAARICMLLCIAGTIFGAWQLILVSVQAGSFTYIAGVRQRFFAANPLLLIIVSTIAPAYILFGSRSTIRAAAISIIPLIPFLMLVGGRSKLLYPIVALGYWICRRVRLSAALIYAGAPMLFLALSLYTFVVRQNGSLDDYPRYLQTSGGITGSLFEEASISMAEIISINVADPAIKRYPWDSVLGGAMLPIPRSIVPFKPLGASTQFTQAVDPERWALVKSEWTITGFVNLLYDFGTFGAFLICFLLSAFWARTLQYASRSRFGTGLVGPACCLVAYQFIRGDLYIVSQFLWPLLFVMSIYWALLRLIRLFTKQPRHRINKATVG